MSERGNSNETVDGIIKRLDIKVSASPAEAPAALQGLAFAVKDMFDNEGETPGFGSPDWKTSHAPSSGNAPCLDILLQAGAHLVANTICDELAFSLDGINIHYGTPINPRAPERIPGGSSSGPASVVAQGIVDFALGTDTAGSTRVPASYCGIWGLRPTWGSISTEGVLPLGPSFDTVGLLASSLDVLTKVSGVLLKEKQSGKADTLIAAKDAFALMPQALLPPLVAAQNRLRQNFLHFQERAVMEEGLTKLVESFTLIRSYEAWQCHGNWYESTAPDLSAAVAGRLLACRGTDRDEVRKGRIYRREAQARFAQLLQGAVICLPTTAQVPPLKTAFDQELESNRRLNLKLNLIASFLGLPQLTIPLAEDKFEQLYLQTGDKSTSLTSGRAASKACGPVPGLSPGLSLIGAPDSEWQLLDIARALIN